MPQVDSQTAGTINRVGDRGHADARHRGRLRFFRLGGRDAAAGGTMPADMAGQGIPSHWNVWVAGDRATRTVARAAAARTSTARCSAAGTPSPSTPPGVTYAIWKLDGKMVGGMLEMNEQWEGIPSAWMAYFAVAGTDDTAFGRIAVLVDPTGGHFSVVTPSPAAG